MLEAVAITFVKFLTNMLLTGLFGGAANVNIEGAPSWFHKTDKARLCVSTYADGGMESIERAKKKAGIAMVKKIDDVIEVVVYENYRNIEDQKEKEFIHQMKEDEYLPIFVKRSMNYRNVEYIKKQRRTFVQGCIDNAELIQYQDERAKKMVKKLSHFRADRGFDELENE